MSKIDTWSTRIANFSQIGVLALAAFGYFYTVLPVYQKSLLDEEIAKKTLELEKKDKQLLELNETLNQRSIELNQLLKEVNQAKDEAKSAKSNLKLVQGKFSKQYSELRVHLLSQFISLAYSECYKSLSNSNNLSQCFTNIAESSNLRELNQKDKGKIKNNIAKETPKLLIDYVNKKNALEHSLKKIDERIFSIDKECESNKLKDEYKDKFKKIDIDFECDNKKREMESKASELKIKFIFAKQKLISENLEAIAQKTLN